MKLTTEQAEAGVRPPIMTREQWDAMYTASLQAEAAAQRRTQDELLLRTRTYNPRASFKNFGGMMDTSQLAVPHIDITPRL